MNKISYNLIILFLSIYSLALYFRGEINKFINEKYSNFNLAAAVVGIVFSLTGIFLIARKRLPVQFNVQILKDLIKSIDLNLPIGIVFILIGIITKTYIFSLIFIIFFILRYKKFSNILNNPLEKLLIVVILIGFFYPASSLKSASIGNIDNFNAFQLNNNSQQSNIKFVFDTSKYSIGDWVSSINSSANLEDFKDKDVDIVGFIYKPSENNQNYFIAAKLVVRCCAVDSVPTGLIVNYPNWEKEFSKDSWVRVKGKFDVQEFNGSEQLVIVKSVLEKTEEPEDPYIYL